MKQAKQTKFTAARLASYMAAAYFRGPISQEEIVEGYISDSKYDWNDPTGNYNRDDFPHFAYVTKENVTTPLQTCQRESTAFDWKWEGDILVYSDDGSDISGEYESRISTQEIEVDGERKTVYRIDAGWIIIR